MNRLKLLVLCGGPSTEHEVSLKTAEMILRSLDTKKYKTEKAIIEKNSSWIIHDKKKSMPAAEAPLWLVRSKFDFVFIAIHGAFGEDGQIQAILEWLGIPYSGSGVLSSGIVMDKNISNILYTANGFQVPRYVIHKKNKDIIFPFPLVVKPIKGGSSIGTSIVKTKRELPNALRAAFQEGNRIMLQEYIKGREITCAILEDKNGRPHALPPTEIIPKSAAFFDYRAKYSIGGSKEVTPAKILKKQTQEIQTLALKAHSILGCSGMSRSDFILRNRKFFILETNTIPGMTETSLLPQAARAARISFGTLLDMIIQNGLYNKNHA